MSTELHFEPVVKRNSKTRNFFKHANNIVNLEGPKLNRGEKKARKALMKLGMKQFAGITRVTLRKRDGYIFVINEPEVLKSAEGGNSFVCFGEIKVDDP